MIRLLHQDATAGQRTFFTRYIFAIWLVRYLLLPLESLAELPLQYTQPVGLLAWAPLAWADALHDASVLLILRMLLIVVCGACLWRRTFLACAPIACLLVTLEQTFIRGFSAHMNHAEVNLMFAAYLLTAFAFADYFNPKEEQPPVAVSRFTRDGIPLFSMALVFCLTYYFVGMTRVFYGGSDVYTSHTILNQMLHFSRQPWLFDYSFDDWLLGSTIMASGMKMGYVASTVVELLAPVCLVSRRFRYFFIVFMIGFHVLIVLAMKILFLENMLLLLLLTNFGSIAPLGKNQS